MATHSADTPPRHGRERLPATGRRRESTGADASDLDRALQSLIGTVAEGGGLIALLHPEYGLELVRTARLQAPGESLLRAWAATVQPGCVATLEGPGRDRFAVLVVEVGNGSLLVCALAPASQRARSKLSLVGVELLLRLARDVLVTHSRRQLEEAERLHATARRVAASLDVDEVLAEIVQDATELLGADRGDVTLMDSQMGVLRIVAANWKPDVVGAEWPINKGIGAKAIATRRTIRVSDYRHRRDRIRSLDPYGIRAALCVPLVSRDIAIGTLSVHSTDRDYRFNRHHAELLAAFATYAAIAIDNARRYQEGVTLAKKLSAANEQLVRSLTLQERLVEQVLLDRGVVGITEELAFLLDRPVVIHDYLLRVLAGASPASGPDWRSLSLPGPLDAPPELRKFLAELGARGRLASAPAPIPVGPARLVAPILITSPNIAGYLVIPWHDEIAGLDRALIEVAVTGVALEMAKIRIRVELERELRGGVVMDLLTGAYSSPDVMAGRLAELGFDVSEPRDVVVAQVDARTREARSPLSPAVRRQFADIAGSAVGSSAVPGSMLAMDGDSAVLLVVRRSPGGARQVVEETARLLRGWAPELILSSAVADTCMRVEDYPSAFVTAKGALNAALKLGRYGELVHARELGISQLIISSGSRDGLVDFARRTLGPLLDNDEYARVLMSTLHALADSGFNQRQTARRSFMHHNTVAYRVRKIEEALGMRLADAETRLQLTLALRIASLSNLG